MMRIHTGRFINRWGPRRHVVVGPVAIRTSNPLGCVTGRAPRLNTGDVPGFLPVLVALQADLRALGRAQQFSGFGSHFGSREAEYRVPLCASGL